MSDMDALDQMLADLPRHDASDALVQQVLMRVQEEQEAEAESGVVPGDLGARRRRSQLVRWGAMAAGLVLALGVWATLGSADGDRVVLEPPNMLTKGTTSPADADIELGLSLLRNDVPVALEPGAAALPSDKVLLRYTTDREGFAYLFRSGEDGIEVFHGTPTLPGTHHVAVDGRIVGYGLDGLAGTHRFGVAWSHKPWAPASDGVARAPDGFAAAVTTGPFPRVLHGRLQGVVVDSRPVKIGAP
jgi:hypothetical protein